MGNIQSTNADTQPISSNGLRSEPKTGNNIAQAIHCNSNDISVQFVDVQPGEALQFERSRTKLVAYTAPCELQYIDQDAHRVKEALCMTGVVQQKGCDLIKPELCTFKGIQDSFIKHAKEASTLSETDLLIFFFSGHGILNDENELVGLAPKDYDGTEKTCITSQRLLMWLQSTGYRANILFIIDACYSGGFHKDSSPAESTDSPPDENARKVYVMYSSTSEQESYDHGVLQHSIFSYCLSHAILANAPKEGFSTSLPIKDIEETCKCLTYAICSLLEVEHQMPGLVKSLLSIKTPRLSVQIGSTFKSKPQQPTPYIKGCIEWIKQCAAEGKPLEKLEREGYLKKQPVVDIVLCFMIRYMAYSNVYDRYQNHVDFFPFAYEEVVNTLKNFTHLKFGDRERKLAAKEYEDYVKQYFQKASTWALQNLSMVAELKVS